MNDHLPPLPPALPRQAKPASKYLKFGGLVVGALAFGIALVFMFKGGLEFVRRVRHITRVAQRSGSAGVEAASRPIVASANGATEKTVRQRGREFRVRQYAEAYRANGDHTQPWDADVVRLLESWIDLNYGSETNRALVWHLANKLAATPGCEDPLVLTAAAAIAGHSLERSNLLERAIARFQKSGYQAYPKFYAAVALADSMGSRSSRLASLDAQAVEWFSAGLRDGSIRPGDQEELAEILVNGWGSNFFKRNGAAVCDRTASAKGFGWLGLVLTGEKEITDAWKARGSGWANSVTAEGWRGFSEHIAKAEKALTRAWEQDPQRPLAPTLMLPVAMQTDAETMRTWFDRATEAQVDYASAWQKMRWGLRPRWTGSHEAMLALGVQALKTGRFDTDVPNKLRDCIHDIEAESDLSPGEHIYDRPDIWPHLKEMFEGYIRESSQADKRRWWRGVYAATAYFAQHPEIARTQMEALDWKPERSSLSGWGIDLSLLPAKIAALTGASAERIQQAESSYETGDLEGAIKRFDEIASECEDRERSFCLSRLAATRQEQLLARGEWIDLLPSGEEDSNWDMSDTKARRLRDGGIEVEADADGHGFYCRSRVGADFEVSGEFEIARSSTGDFQAGILMGLPDCMNSVWYGFRLTRHKADADAVVFSQSWGTPQVVKKVSIKEGRNSFQFRLLAGKADAWLNGAQVLKGSVPGRELKLTPSCLLGLGASNDRNETVIRYYNVRTRRILPGAS